MTFTIQQVSLNRLPSKNDPDVVQVVWAADVILVNVSPKLLVGDPHSLISSFFDGRNWEFAPLTTWFC